MGFSLKRMFKQYGEALKVFGTGGLYYVHEKQKEAEAKQDRLLQRQYAQAQQDQLAAQQAIEDEAKKKQQEMQKELLSRYGYTQTIKTSGLGVAGQAPVATKTLLGQ